MPFPESLEIGRNYYSPVNYGIRSSPQPVYIEVNLCQNPNYYSWFLLSRFPIFLFLKLGTAFLSLRGACSTVQHFRTMLPEKQLWNLRTLVKYLPIQTLAKSWPCAWSVLAASQDLYAEEKGGFLSKVKSFFHSHLNCVLVLYLYCPNCITCRPKSVLCSPEELEREALVYCLKSIPLHLDIVPKGH